MWELSVSVSSKSVDVAKFIYQTLKSHAIGLGGVVTCYEQFDNFYIVFGCEEAEKQRACEMIENCIIKTVCNFYKDKYLSENLHLPIKENLSLMAFKKALINFDKETDIFLISKNLKLEKDLHLDSFYYFKLKPLRDKWNEIISLANENGDYLISNEAFFDLLKFLIDNLETCDEEISVFEDENGYYLKLNGQSAQHQKLTKEALVASLIEICPKKINLFCPSDDVAAGFLFKIFEERINVCYNKNIEKLSGLKF